MGRYSLEEKKRRDPRFRAYEEILKAAKELGAITDEDLKMAERNTEMLRLSSDRMDVNMGNVLDDYDVGLEAYRRDLRSRSVRVPEAQRKQYDAMLDQYADLAAECNDEKALFDQYGRIDAALNNEKFRGNPAAEALMDRIMVMELGDGQPGGVVGLTATKADLSARRLQFNEVFEYAWGVRNTTGKIQEQEQALREAMGPDAYRDFLEMARTIHEAEPLKKAPTQAAMRLEEGIPGLHEAFLGGGENLKVDGLTPRQRSFAVRNFDAAFNDIFPEDMVNSFRAEGKDILDQVYIDGVSVSEKYGAEYAGRPYYAAAEAMKCRMMADLMNGAHIQAAVPSADAPDGFVVVPLSVQTEIELVQNRLGSHPQTKTEEQLRQGIVDSQTRLQKRNDGEKAKAEARIRQADPSLPDMPMLIMESISKPMLPTSDEKMNDILFRMGSQADGTLITDKDMLSAGSYAFGVVASSLVEADRLKHPRYAKMGIKTVSDLIYIDGKPAKEYFSRPGGPTPTREQIEAGITAAMMSGEHHVDLAQIGTDKDGRYIVQVSEIKRDLHFMDGKEKWYQQSRAHKVDRLVENTKEMESRHAAVREPIAERLVQLISAEHREQENPYLAQQQRFRNEGRDLTAAYFGKEERDALKESVGGHRELDRETTGEYGACLHLAQLVLMGEHPEIRYADLMNPHRFQKEKLEAGKKVTEALADFKTLKEHPDSQPDFEKLAVIMATAIRAAGRIDIRRELLYAMGQPEHLSADAMRAAMATLGGNLVANGLLDSLGRFGQSVGQVVSRLNPEQDDQEIDEISENSFIPYGRLNELLTPEERNAYRNAIRGLEAGLQPEARWMEMMTNPASQDSEGTVLGLNASMTEVREWIVNDGAAGNLDGKFLTGITTLQRQADQYAQAHTGALTSRMRQELMYGGTHISPGDIRADQGRAGWNAWSDTYRAELDLWAPDMTSREEVDLNQRSGFYTITRRNTLTAVAQGRMMARGLSLDEVLALSDEQKIQEGKNLLHFINERPVNTMEAGTERDEALEDYADHYIGWGRQLFKEKIPDIDFNDPGQLTGKDGDRLKILACHLTDFGQTRQNLEKDPKFAQSLPQDIRDAETMAGVCQILVNACSDRFSRESVSRLAGMSVLQIYGPKLAGRELGELGRFVDMKEMNQRLTITKAVMDTVTERERQQYLLQGRIPEELMDIIDREMEKAQAEARTRQANPPYADLPEVTAGSVRGVRITLDMSPEENEARKDRLFRLGSQVKAAQTTGITDEDLVQEGVHALDRMMENAMGKDGMSHPVFQRMGFRSSCDLIYIDGKPAREYFSGSGSEPPKEEQIKAGIMAAMMSGEHHVDMAQIGTDKQGRYTVQVSELKPDLHFMDGREKWYQRSRAHKMDSLVGDTKGRESRHAAIRGPLAETLASKLTDQLREQENPYTAERNRFLNKGTALAATYFGKEERETLQTTVGGYKELGRGDPGELGGCVRLAQLVLMAEHPEIRYADLMNPHKFQEEKLAAGKKVAEAMEDVRTYNANPASNPGFEKLTNVLATAVKGMNSIDVRRELLYAMGQPENLSADAMRAALATPEGSITASGFLDSIGKFGQSASQAISAVGPNNTVQSLDKINENSFTPYKNLREILSSQEIETYMRAKGGLEKMFLAEGNWIKTVAGVNASDSMERLVGLNASMAEAREWVVNDGALKNVTEKTVRNVTGLGMLASQYVQAHSEMFTPEMIQAMRYAGMHVNPGEIRANPETLAAGRAGVDAFLAEQGTWGAADVMSSKYAELEREGGIQRIASESGRSHIIQGWMMAQGHSPDELKAFSQEKKEQAENDLFEFIDKRRVNTMKAGAERDQALKDYADLYNGWGRQLSKEKIPNIDFTDRSKLTEAMERLSFLGNQASDYDESMQHLAEEPKFTEEIAQDVWDGISSRRVCQTWEKACEYGFNGHSAFRLAGMEMMQRYGQKLAGREISELSGVVDYAEMDARMTSTLKMSLRLTEEERQQYLVSGIPKEVMDDIDREVEAAASRRRAEDEAKWNAHRSLKTEDAKNNTKAGDAKKEAAPAASQPAQAPVSEAKPGAAADKKSAKPLPRPLSFSDMSKLMKEQAVLERKAMKSGEAAANESPKSVAAEEKRVQPRSRAKSFSEVSAKMFPEKTSGSVKVVRQHKEAAPANQNQNQVRIPG